MATNINSTRTENKFAKHVEIWVVDPFFSIMKRVMEKRIASYVISSPVIQTWWQDKFQVELKFVYKAGDIYNGHKPNITCQITFSHLNPKDKVTGWEGNYHYYISEFMDKTEKIIFDSQAVWSSVVYDPLLERVEALKLKIEIYFYPTKKVQSTPALLNSTAKFATIRETEELLDFSIFVNGQELKVSKTVLALASPVFLAMLVDDFKEKETQTIHIDDVGIDTVRRFLDFIYTSEPPTFTNIKSIVELLHMADKYQVLTLRKLCLEHINSTYPDKD